MDLLAGLSGSHMAALRACGSVRSHPAGTILFKEGDPAYGLCGVLSGTIEVFRRTDEGEVRLAIIEKDQILGEMGILLKSASRTAAARVLEDAVLFEITSDPIAMLKALSPVDQGRGAIRLLQNIIHTLAERLRSKESPEVVKSRRNVGLPLGGLRGAGLEDDPSKALAAIRANLPAGLLSSWWHDRNLKQGEYLYRQGESSTSLYFLREGQIELRHSKQGAADVPIAMLSAPSVAGEVGYFLKEPRATSAVALTSSHITQFPAKDFNVLAKNDPDSAFQLLFGLAQWIAWLILERETKT